MVDGVPAEKEPKILINEYYEEMGHPNFALTSATAKAQNIKLEGHSAPCSVCTLSKAQQKRISKLDIKPQATKPIERLFLDILFQRKQSLGWKNQWLLIVNDMTDNDFFIFIENERSVVIRIDSFH